MPLAADRISFQMTTSINECATLYVTRLGQTTEEDGEFEAKRWEGLHEIYITYPHIYECVRVYICKYSLITDWLRIICTKNVTDIDICNLIKLLLKFVNQGSVDKYFALVQVMAWRRANEWYNMQISIYVAWRRCSARREFLSLQLLCRLYHGCDRPHGLWPANGQSDRTVGAEWVRYNGEEKHGRYA